MSEAFSNIPNEQLFWAHHVSGTSIGAGKAVLFWSDFQSS